MTPKARSFLSFATVLIVLGGGFSDWVHGQCGEWSSRLGLPDGVNQPARAVITWDPDGAGPQPRELLVGGDFSLAGGRPARGIASWNGDEWRAVGDGPGPGVYCLAAWDADGAGPDPAQVVAGGIFSLANGGAADRVARWDGVAWQPIAGGIPGASDHRVSALASWDPDAAGPLPPRLFACGNFSSPAGRIAMWNGSAWTALGAGLSGGSAVGAHALATWDPDGAGPLGEELIVGGAFATAGGASANNIARWDGANWRRLGDGVSGAVYALTTWDPDGAGPLAARLVAAGDFATAGGQPANRVAQWDGSTWQPIGNGLDAWATSLTTWDPDDSGPQAPVLVAAGAFRTAGGLSVERVAWWNGSLWLPFDGGIEGFYNGPVFATTVWDADESGPERSVLVCVGAFTLVSDTETRVHNVARWDGVSWQPYGSGFNEWVRALTLWDADGDGPAAPELVAGGDFTAARGAALNHVGRWDGSAWRPLGSGFDAGVFAVGSWDADGVGPLSPTLIAGGLFANSGSTPVSRVASWDGAAWNPLGSGATSTVYAITSWDPDGPGAQQPVLVIGGRFSSVGGQSARGVAWWDGIAWHAFGEGLSNGVNAVASWDADGDGPQPAILVAGGPFDYSGTTNMRHIAQWDGSAWQPLAQGLGLPAYSSEVLALTSWDPDGAGPLPARLVAGGTFTLGAGAPANFIAQWHGTHWTPVGNVEGRVYALASWDPDALGPIPPQLVAGGSFDRAGGVTVNKIARWDGVAWHPFGAGIDEYLSPYVYALASLPQEEAPDAPTLVAGGILTSAGGQPAAYVAAWDTFDPEVVITASPQNTSICQGETATFTVAATGVGALSYQWRRDEVDLSDGPGGRGSVISGAQTPILTIAPVTSASLGAYDCVVTGPCESSTSEAALLTPLVCPGSGDLNCDGYVNFFDIDPFVTALFNPAAYAAQFPGCDILYADLDGSGSVNFFDIDPFVACIFGDCP